MGDDWTTTRTEEEATAACASICSGQDGGTPYKFMGLQWSNECWCGNEFGSKGTAEEADPVDGRGVCDVDGDGTPDCGQGVPDATDPPSATRARRGRRGRSSPANSMKSLAAEANTSSARTLLGATGAIAGL